jgi:hypothetical protein
MPSPPCTSSGSSRSELKDANVADVLGTRCLPMVASLPILRRVRRGCVPLKGYVRAPRQPPEATRLLFARCGARVFELARMGSVPKFTARQ